MIMSSGSSSWLVKIILKQERRLRKEYEESYLFECWEKGNMPLPYAAWRRGKMEPKALELLLDEGKSNYLANEETLQIQS